MELREHQKKAVLESPDKWGLWFRMRVGKTPTAIRLANSRCKSALIICPKGLVIQWANEIKQWSIADTEFFIISRDQFKKHFTHPGKEITTTKLHKCEAVIVDECHRGFGNYKSRMFKCLDFYLKHYDVHYRWLLSGTPFTATSWSVYSYGKLLDKKDKTGQPWSWFKWNKAFFDMVKMGRLRVPVAKKGVNKTLQRLLREMGTVIDLKEVAEVADDVDVFEYFKLNKRQQEEIKNLDEDVPAVEYCKTHQLEQGSLNSDGYREELSFKIDKDDRLIELAANYEKLVIVCKYKAQLRKVAKLFPGRRIYLIWGESKEQSSVIASRAEQDDNCIVIIQSDTCDGYSLKSFDTMVFASMSYSFVNYDQIRSRIKAMEKKTPNTYIHLLTEGESLDNAVKESIDKKQTFSFELYASRRIPLRNQD
jgi:hypothetical protein